MIKQLTYFGIEERYNKLLYRVILQIIQIKLDSISTYEPNVCKASSTQFFKLIKLFFIIL